MKEKPIHLCDEAQQPSIHIACSWKWTTPAWGEPKIYAPNVYYDDEGELYTFREELVTCKLCELCISRYKRRDEK